MTGNIHNWQMGEEEGKEVFKVQIYGLPIDGKSQVHKIRIEICQRKHQMEGNRDRKIAKFDGAAKGFKLVIMIAEELTIVNGINLSGAIDGLLINN